MTSSHNHTCDATLRVFTMNISLTHSYYHQPSSPSRRPSEVLAVRGRKGFVKLALETGAQIVPCYCFGSSQIFDTPFGSDNSNDNGSGSWVERLSRRLRAALVVFWGRFGLPIPFRAPLLTVIGRPIPVPKVNSSSGAGTASSEPSAELVNEYHDLYLRETRRIYDKYKNCYGWQHKPLVFKR